MLLIEITYFVLSKTDLQYDKDVPPVNFLSRKGQIVIKIIAILMSALLYLLLLKVPDLLHENKSLIR